MECPKCQGSGEYSEGNNCQMCKGTGYFDNKIITYILLNYFKENSEKMKDAFIVDLFTLIESTLWIEKIMYKVRPDLWSDVQYDGYVAFENGKKCLEKSIGLSWEKIKALL